MIPIRVLHIVTAMNRGGLETLLMNYYRKIDREKIQFDFLTHRNTPAAYDGEIKALGGKIFYLPRLNPFSASYKAALNGFFRTHPEYRIVHCHQDCLSAIPLAAAKKNGVPVLIAHSHSSSQDKNLKYLVKRYYMRKIPSAATHLFACGDKAGRWMFKGRPFTVMRNAIDAADYRWNEAAAQKKRAELGITDRLAVGHVGSFRKPKNHAFLLAVFKAVLELEKDAVLLLAGDGELRVSMEKRARKLGLTESVRFLGLRSDVPDLLRAMDVFLFPSLYEGLPMTLVEAQAAGLPILASSAVPKESAVAGLVEFMPLSDTPQKWADKLLKMAREAKRRDTYDEIAAAQYDISANAKWLEEFYQCC